MNGSATTQPELRQPSTLTDWITVLHNAAQVPQDSPRYTEAQQVMQNALINVQSLGQEASQQDILQAGQLAPGKLGSALAGVVGFGRGASLGLVKPPTVDIGGQATDVIGLAHPTATTVGDIAGGAALATVAAPLVAGLSPTAAGATLFGGLGAARGAIDPALTGDRKIDAALGGLTGLVGGAIVGKIGGKLAPAVTQVGRNIMKLIGARAEQAGTQAVGKELVDATEATLRRFLEAKGVPADQIEQTIARSRPLWEGAAPKPALSAQARPVAPAEPRVAPAPAATPTTAPTPVTPISIAPRAAAEVPAPSATGAVTKSGRNVADILREGEQVMGRPLSAAEKDAVLQRLFGARTSHPSHPIWFGPGAPTE